MAKTRTAVHVGAAALALGLSLAGPQAVGIASADSPDTDSASASGVTAPSKASTARGPVARRSVPERTGRPPGSSASSARRGAQSVEPDVAAVPPAVVSAVPPAVVPAVPPAVVPAEAAAVAVGEVSRPATATGRGQSGRSAPAAFVGSGLLDPAATAQAESGHSALAGPAAVDTPASDPVGSSLSSPTAAAAGADPAPPVGGDAVGEVSTAMASLPTPSAPPAVVSAVPPAVVPAVPPAVVPAEAAAVAVGEVSRPATATGRGQSGRSAPAAFVGSGLLDPAATAQAESGHSALAGPAAVDTPASDPVGSSLSSPTAAAAGADPAPPVGGDAVGEVSTAMASLPTPSALAAASLPEPPAATATPSGVLWDINTAVVRVFDTTQNWLAALPANPFSDLLEGALLLVRRSLFNQVPTTAPVQIKTLVNGQIEGTLGAVDPEGDPLSYVLTEIPQQGTVQLNPDGTYVYTPGPDYSGADRFTVAVNDGGFNILNPSGSWRPAEAVGRVGDDGVDPSGLVITRALTIQNLTGSDLVLADFSATRTVNNVAPLGTVLQPTESTSITLTQYAFVNNRSTFFFGRMIEVPEGFPTPGFSGYFDLEPLATNWGCTGSTNNCQTSGSTTNRTAVLRMLDLPGTVINIPSGQGQQQADVLNQLCGSSSATCTFTPKSFDSTSFTDWKLASDSVSNNTTSPLTTTITVTTQQQTATTLKLTTSAKVTVFEIVELGVTTEASQTWTDTYTFSQAITVTAQPGEKVSIESRDPVKSVTGDFTLTMGNTTWNLTDVNFDSPDPDRRSEYNATTTPIRAVV